MTEENFNKFVAKVTRLVENRPDCLRLGQATFNYAFRCVNELEDDLFDSNLMESFNNKDVDPFYDDSKIFAFWESLHNELVTEK